MTYLLNKRTNKRNQIYLVKRRNKSTRLENETPYNLHRRSKIHKRRIKLLTKLQFPMALMKRTMESIYEIDIIYLTYLVLNNMKLDNKLEPILPPFPTPFTQQKDAR